MKKLVLLPYALTFFLATSEVSEAGIYCYGKTLQQAYGCAKNKCGCPIINSGGLWNGDLNYKGEYDFEWTESYEYDYDYLY